MHTQPSPATKRPLFTLVAALVGIFVGAACDIEEPNVDDRSDDAPRVANADEVEEFTAMQEDADADRPALGVEEFSSSLHPTEKHTITVCSCGSYNGSPLYVGVECAGYPSAAVCCAEKCSELMAALDAQD